MKKLIVLSIFCLSQAAFALQAPFLYTADSASDTTIQLTWRNNSTAYLGIVVLRKTAAAGQYAVVDTAPGTATAFTDTVRPAAQTTYYYALTAYSQTEQADTSNVDSARLTPKPFDGIFVAPSQLNGIYDTLTHVLHLYFYDSSNVESGYRIYKSSNFGAFEIMRDIPSPIPSQMGYINDSDATVSSNSWYMYYVVAYKGQQTLSSVTDTVFTFDVDAMKRNSPKKCTVLDQIGSFPINYGSWSLKSGDTIVLNESNAPDSMFSIIDVSNPSQPRFAGTGKSGAAVIFYYSPARQLSAYTKGEYVFNPTGDSLSCYKYQSGAMQNLSTINVGETVLTPCGFLSDSVLVVPTFTESLTTAGRFSNGTSYSSAAEILFKNGILTYSEEEFVYENSCSNLSQTICGYSNSPTLASGVLCQGRLFTGIPGYMGLLRSMAVFDFTYQVPSKTVFSADVSSLTFFDIQLAGNGVWLDAPALTADSSWIRSYSHAILLDTVKNLVFALSDSELSVYNCQIVSGISHPVSSTHLTAQILRVGKGANGSASLIFLPRHTQPASVSIFDLSGRRIARMEGIQGETVAWPHQNRTGVYILRAVIDGNAVAAKVILNK